MQLQVGANFAGYVIERCLGTGGMGSVYLARHPRLERSVALKLMTDGYNADPKVRAAFDREVSVAARLDHPNIVAVYDRSGPEDDALWLTMRYIAGGDAGVLLDASPRGLAPEHAVRIIGDAAEALDFAHDQGVVHRDVKPANLMVEHGARGEIRALLTDFGIARTRDDTVTMSSISASFAYAAPERFSHTADHRSDIYSLGCTLYHLLTGMYPFPRGDQAAVIAAHLTAPPPSPRELRPELPTEFDAVIATAMAKKPDRRYPTCGALADAARDALSSVAISQLVSVPNVTRDVDSAAPSRKRTRPLSTPADRDGDIDRADEGQESSSRPKSARAEDVPRETRARVESVELPGALRRESAPTDRAEPPAVPSVARPPESASSERVEPDSAPTGRPRPGTVSPHESGPDPVAARQTAIAANEPNDRGVEPVGARRLDPTLPDPDLPDPDLPDPDLPDPDLPDPDLPDPGKAEPGDSNPTVPEADPSNRGAAELPPPTRSTDSVAPARRRVLMATVVGSIVFAVGVAVATALVRAPADAPATPSPVPAVPAGPAGRSTTPTAEPIVVRASPTQTRTTRPPAESPPAESSALDVVELPATPPAGPNSIQPPASLPLFPPTEDAAADVGQTGSSTATPPPTSHRPVTSTTVPPTTSEPTTTPTISPSTTPPTTSAPTSTAATDVPISTTVPG
ncbi:protein kinase [Nocardia sp. NPDC005366]|uniref:serine/threonine-protein kinase n=1 Tax=Nocardia sp. NPDC005366 TaxID=3156878 RepID=UPI0033A3649B